MSSLDNDKDLLAVAQRLRDNKIRNYKNRLKCTEGALAGRRVYFFEGKKLIDSLLKANEFKHLELTTRNEASYYATRMLANRYFHLAMMGPKPKPLPPPPGPFSQRPKTPLPVLGPCIKQIFKEDGIFVWILEESKFWLIFQSILLVIVILAACLIKIWPLWLKIALWWVSLSFLVAVLSLVFIRLILWFIMWPMGYGHIWLLPNMFDDNLGFLECYIPLWGIGIADEIEIEKEKEKQKNIKKSSPQPKTPKKTENTDNNNNNNFTDDNTLKRSNSSQKLKRRKKKEKEKEKEESIDKNEKIKTSKQTQSNTDEDIEERFMKKKKKKFDWKIPVINLILVLILGILTSLYFGLLSTSFVPNIIMSSNDIQRLHSQFKFLGPPPPNVTEDK